MMMAPSRHMHREGESHTSGELEEIIRDLVITHSMLEVIYALAEVCHLFQKEFEKNGRQHKAQAFSILCSLIRSAEAICQYFSL